MTAPQQHPAFILTPPPGQPNNFVFAAPHSGRLYPEAFRARSVLSADELRQSEDAFVDELYAWVPEQGASLLAATHARAYLDLNRAANELDPNMFSPPLLSDGLDISPRVLAGLGLIPSIVAEGAYIYKEPLPAREAEKRTRDIHQPYHGKLYELLDNRRKRFGTAFLIDCHSMPSEASVLTGKSKHPDIILGDSWGSACSTQFTALTEEALLNAGFQVRRNVPYSGGYSTQHYGNPNGRLHALQIEINRGLYMNERTYEKLASFEAVKAALKTAMAQVISELATPVAGSEKNSLQNAAE